MTATTVCQLDYVQMVKRITSHSFDTSSANSADSGGGCATFILLFC
jgi:hypothetical protein